MRRLRLSELYETGRPRQYCCGWRVVGPLPRPPPKTINVKLVTNNTRPAYSTQGHIKGNRLRKNNEPRINRNASSISCDSETRASSRVTRCSRDDTDSPAPRDAFFEARARRCSGVGN